MNSGRTWLTPWVEYLGCLAESQEVCTLHLNVTQTVGVVSELGLRSHTLTFALGACRLSTLLQG